MNYIYNELVTSDAAGYHPPMLIDQLGYLYNITNSADQKLGEDVYVRFEGLEQDLTALQSRWENLQEEIE